MWPWWVKIPSEDFIDETLVWMILLEVMVLRDYGADHEVDKVADEVTDMEIDK